MFLEWENSRKFQNNFIIDVKQISLSHAIRYLVLVTEALNVNSNVNLIISKSNIQSNAKWKDDKIFPNRKQK